MILDALAIAGGVLSLVLSMIVLTNGASKRKLKFPFATFAGSISLWAIFIGCFHFTQSEDLAVFFVTAYYVAALMIPASFLLFALHYVDIKVSRITTHLVFLPWLVVSCLVILPGHLATSVSVSGGAHDVHLNSGFYMLYSFIFVAYALIGLTILWINTKRAKRAERLRLFLAVILTVCFAGGAFFNLVLPWMNTYSLIAVGPLFTFLMVAAIFYAIARHGLFDIRLAVIRSMTYVFTLGTLTLVYLGVAFFVFNHILGQQSTIHQTLLNVMLTLALAFAFQPIKRFFDRWTNRVFYKDIYNADEFYADLNVTLTSTTTLTIMLHRTASLIQSTMKSEQAHFFVYGEAGKVVATGTEGFRKVPAEDFNELRAYSPDAIISIDEELPKRIRHILISHRLSLVMPLKRKDGVIGFLSMGEHRNSHYSYRDLRVLRTISAELVIAIQNALSVQEVRELNESLEQRIATATKELRASNAQLQRLDEVKDEFMSMASHQLRTPLTSIKGYVSMLLEGDAGEVTEEQKNLLREAFNSSERMVRLIGDFLNVSRLQTGKFVIDAHPVNLVTLVQSELDSLKHTASSRGHEFQYTQSKNIPDVQMDENKMQQVIMNFADNALYYSKEPSIIKVSVRKVDNWVEFTIKDKGIGVPLEQQEQLFGKFFRATNARRQRPDGTGVGLFLAKKVIDAHHGEIIFSSTEGKGSTFGFRLPLS